MIDAQLRSTYLVYDISLRPSRERRAWKLIPNLRQKNLQHKLHFSRTFCTSAITNAQWSANAGALYHKSEVTKTEATRVIIAATAS